MGSGINPQMILQMLKQKMGAAGGGMPGAPGGGEESTAGRELQGADPGYALKMVNDLKKKIVDLFPTLSFRAPAAARALMSSMKGIDTAIKELQQAAQTLQAVGGPLQMSAVPTSMPPGGSGALQLMNPANAGM